MGAPADRPPGGPFARLGRLAVRRRRAVLAACALLVVLGTALVPAFQDGLLGVGYDTPGSESDRATRQLAQATGTTERALLVVEVAPGSERVLRPALERAIAAVRAVDDGLRILPPGAPGGGVLAPDGRAATAVVGFTGPAAERQELSHELQDAVDAAVPAGATAGLTGNSPLLADLIHVEERDLLKAEIVGLPIAGLVLLLAFGSVVAAGLPLLIGICGLLITFGLVAVVMLVMDFNVFVESLIAMVGLGVGIDYALLVVRRFREERAAGRLPADAVVTTIATAGRTIAFSGAIVATSLVPVAVADLPFFGEAAVGCILVVAVAVALSLTLLPALLLTLGDRLERGRLPRRTRPDGGGEGWARWARFVIRRPWPILLAGAALLLAAAFPITGLRTGVDLNARAMPQEESVKALTALQRHVPGAALAPVEVLVTGADRAVPAARDAAARLARAEPRLTGVQVLDLGSGAALVSAAPTVPVDSAAASELVRDLRRELAAARVPGTEALVTGASAEGLDYSDRTNDAAPWVIGVALGLSFVLLLAVFRSPVLAVKAIVLNLLSIGAALGLVVLVFQEGLGESVLDFTSPGYLQSWMPLTLFLLLFGLSMDYEVFMVSRMRERWLRSRDTADAVAHGLQRTGVVVTSAAAIMVAIFSSFVLTSIPEMKQMGFGLAVAVLIDATIVRAALVPAFMAVAGRWNWWAPAWLDRVVPHVHEEVGERRAERPPAAV